MIRRLIVSIFILSLLISSAGCVTTQGEALSPDERVVVDRILDHWKTWVPQKQKEGQAPIMTFEELYEGLGPDERAFLDRIRAIDPRRSFGFRGIYLGSAGEVSHLKRIEGQWIKRKGRKELMDPQYLPEPVYEAYQAMMGSMEKDIRKRLWVESGYRSPAYQLHTFIYFLPKHGYSLKETGRWVALPGYSEHGTPLTQAIDFMSQEGITGEDDPEDFERTPEYQWLQQHAGEFGFELSYPRPAGSDETMAFEPWHWRHVGIEELRERE